MTEQGRSYAEVLRRGPATRLRRGRPDARRGRHRRRPQAGHPRADRLRRRRAAGSHRAPRHRRHRRSSTSASPASWATRSSCWPRPGSIPTKDGGQLALHVSPVLLRHKRRWPRCAAPTTPSTSSATRSATRSTTAAAPGRCRPPAPSSPTSSTWRSAGRSGPSGRLRLWSGNDHGIALRDPSTVRSRFYLRLMVEDRPGVLAEITRILADHQISISSVIQHEALDEPTRRPRSCRWSS